MICPIVGVAERASAVDRAASLDAFDIEPCAPTIRRAFDRYRAEDESRTANPNISACPPHGDTREVINTWSARVAPREFLPLMLLFTLPVLGLIGWRVSGRARS